MSEYKIIYKVDDGLIRQMIELDKLVYNGLDVGNYNRCKKWVEANPQIYTVLLCNEEVVGYINCMPITDRAYEKIKMGQLKDFEITNTDIVKFESFKRFKCYFMSIVIRPDYQSSVAIIRLWKGFINKLKYLNISISGIVMDCVSNMGEECAKRLLGAKFITNSCGGKIYEGNLNWGKRK